MSLSSNPPSDWPTVSELLDEALALRAHEFEAWFASLQGAPEVRRGDETS